VGKVEKKEVKKPLCIVGTALSSGDAPYDLEIDGDYMYDIWVGGNALAKKDVKRADVAFELHPIRYWGQLAIMQKLVEYDIPICMQQHNKEIPKSYAYPREEVKKMFHHKAMGDNLFATNTITWMILCALYEGYTDISLYGIHMAHETEYAYQRASCAWVMGIIHGYILAGKKYKFFIHDSSSVMRAEYEYGFDEPTQTMQYLEGRQEGMKKGIAEADAQIKSLEVSKYRTEGAMSEAAHIYKKIAGWN